MSYAEGNKAPTIDEQSIEQNLAQLPSKVAKALEGLLAINHIDERLVRTLCKAGELSGNAHVLLGFAVSMSRLEATNVPIVDVIDMAYKHGHRIQLTWSAQRWKDEHNKLSRLETLKALAAVNQNYTLDMYTKHLPDRWPGYLIGGSRRLGMEGLRQRHCVASYHNRLKKCEMAIAVVFVDHVLWTVGLTRTNDEQHPLQISTIRSRFNNIPTVDERDKIYEALKIKQPINRPVSEVAAKPRMYAENLQRLIPVLIELGIEKVYVSFDGSGDSGMIDSVNFYTCYNRKFSSCESLNASDPFYP